MMWARKHNVYIVLFGLSKTSKKHSHKHPDVGVVKIMHPNLSTLAYFKPHGAKVKDRTEDICYNSQLSHIVTCGGPKEGKICVWDLYNSDEDLSSASEDEEYGATAQNKHIVLNISPITQVEVRIKLDKTRVACFAIDLNTRSLVVKLPLTSQNEMGPVTKLKVGVCVGEQTLVAVTKNSVLLYTQTAQLLKLTGAIEELYPSTVKITEIEFIGGEGKDANDTLIAGLSDGTITVWALKPFLGLEIRRSAEIVCSFTAHRTVGSGLGVIELHAELAGNMWETPVTASVGNGEFSFVSIGEVSQ